MNKNQKIQFSRLSQKLKPSVRLFLLLLYKEAKKQAQQKNRNEINRHKTNVTDVNILLRIMKAQCVLLLCHKSVDEKENKIIN